jgi:hypothetical protein
MPIGTPEARSIRAISRLQWSSLLMIETASCAIVVSRCHVAVVT